MIARRASSLGRRKRAAAMREDLKRRSDTVRRGRYATLVAFLLTFSLGPGGQRSAATGEAALAQSARPTVALPRLAQMPAQGEGISYQLVDTWQKRPWRLTPGRYGRVLDITSTPGGKTLVLDGRHNVVHVVGRDGQPQGIIRIPHLTPGDGWAVQRLDAGFDDTFYVLCQGPYEMSSTRPQRLVRLASDGRHLATIELEVPAQTNYIDVAVAPDGRLYLVRTGPRNPYLIWPGPTPTPEPAAEAPDDGVDVFDERGRRLAVISPPEMDVPFGVDVDARGQIYVLNRVPVPWQEPPAESTATPRPSLLGTASRGQPSSDDPRQMLTSRTGPFHALRPAQSPTAVPTAVEGVMFFTADHRYQRTWPFAGPEDLAVGPSGVFVSRQVDVHRVPETEPLYTGPLGRVHAAMLDDIVFHLDVATDGRLRAGMSHCLFQGILDFGVPLGRPVKPNPYGDLDRPELEGPVYPLRLAASGGRVLALQGRYTIEGLRPNHDYLAHPFAIEPQTIQVWQSDGRLERQWGICSGSESWWVRDVAIEGSHLYTVDHTLLQHRMEGGFPDWSYVPSLTLPLGSPSRLSAVDAAAGRLAVLDSAANRVTILAADGSLGNEWPLGAPGGSMPSDLAMTQERIYVADAGRRRVLVRSLDGIDIGEWPTLDAPIAIDVGPTGDVFILGRGGWMQRYRPDGTRVALWSSPFPDVDALDLAVDDGGTVYVAFVGRDRTGLEPRYANDPVFHIRPAGIWLFREVKLSAAPSVPTQGCAAASGKVAQPRRLPLGDEVIVSLTVDGQCPRLAEPALVILVYDTSRSMNWNNALERAKDAGLQLVQMLADSGSKVGLVTFDDGPALRLPPTDDTAALRAAIAGLQAWGDTRLAGGIEVARQAIETAAQPGIARRAIVILTDGVIKDDPVAAAAEARETGIEMHGFLFPTYEYEPVHWDTMAEIVGNADHVWRDPDAGIIASLTRDLVRERSADLLFDSITILDWVPENMRYVVGSAEPPADWTASERLLRWSLGPVAHGRALQLRYRLQPLQTGTWPTNISATAHYTDALGQPGQLAFPVPMVDVYAPQRAVYLPRLLRQSCQWKPQPLDIVLLLDASSSMLAPAAGAGTKLEAATRAAAVFVGLLRHDLDRAAVISFNDRAEQLVGLSGDRRQIEEALARIATREGTAIDLGLQAAAALLSSEGRSTAVPIIVLLTDGIQTLPGDPGAEAQRLKEANVILFVVGLGREVDRAELEALASGPERYLEAPSTAELEKVFRDLASRIVCDED